MKKIKTFFHVFINSLFPLDHYYKKIVKTNLFFSLKYFFTLIFVLSFILISVFVLRNFLIKNNVNEFKISLINSLNNYPQNLTIAIKNNQLTTNFNRPYIFWLTYKKIPHPLIVIDERATAEKIYQFDSTTILVNSNGLIRRAGNGLRYYPFKTANNLVINKQRVENFKNLILYFSKFALFLIPVILILTLVALVIFFSLIKMFYLALISFFAFWVIKIFGIKTRYKKLFQISLHSNTLPIICQFAILILGWRARSPFWYLFLTLVFFSTAIYETYCYQVPKTAPHKIHHKKHTRLSHSTR